MTLSENLAIAISAKTLNTNSKTYIENPSAIYGKLKGYIDKTLKFKEASRKIDEFTEVKLSSQEIKQRVIQLGVPENISDTAIKQLQRAIDYGNLNNVEIVIRKIGK